MKNILIILSLVLIQSNTWAQDNSPIFTYGKDTVYQEEFMRVFNKNRRSDAKPSKAEIEEYLELYIKFKLKVQQAYDMGMQNDQQFLDELAMYRKQLAKPYLTDKSVNERLMKEAYERSKQEIRAAHILVLCPEDASPADTLAALKKIENYRQRAINGKQEFEELAFMLSDDPSAKNNKGDLGYFTAFNMIYPFENAAYNTEVNSISKPFRTRFGYHIVKVYDKRPVLNDVQVAHIMIKYYNDMDVDSAKRRINAIYTKLQQGGDWKAMVEEYSEDFSTNGDEGKLNWFNRKTPNVPPTFKEVAYELKKGEMSAPFQTRFGWHIMLKLDERELGSYEETKESIRRAVERDSRSELNRSVVLERVKKENNFNQVSQAKDIESYFDERLIAGTWDFDSKMNKKEVLLFTIADQNYTLSNFMNYAKTNQSKVQKSLSVQLAHMYQLYIDDMNLKYEEDHLEEKYDDFKYIMQEYKDGMLLFDLTDSLVWTKAINDTTGLKAYYDTHQDNYMYPERAEVALYSFKDEKIAKKALKKSEKMSDTELKAKFNDDDALAVNVEVQYMDKEEIAEVDFIDWAIGTYKKPDANGRVKYAKVRKILPPEPKPLEKNMGRVTSDYQNALEQQWLKQLHSTYPRRNL